MRNCSDQPQPQLPPRLSSPPKATNENHITVNIPPQQVMQAPQGESKAIMLHPQPIQLAVETSTDWPAITATIFSGFAGALVAFAVGWMAYIGQRNQVRAAKANFRHDWQKEIKQLIGKFISTSARINYELEGNPDYLSNSESNQIFSELMETHARIELMLDRKKPYYNDISRIT